MRFTALVPGRLSELGPTQVAEGSFNDTNTRPYTPDDFRFTTKGDILYAIELGLSLRRSFTRLEPERLASEPSNQSNSWLRREGFFQTKPDGLHIQLPEQAPGKYADTFRIQFAERK